MQPAGGATRPRAYHYPFSKERALRHAILSGQRVEAMRAFEAFFGFMLESSTTIRHLKSDSVHLMVVLIRKCFQSGMVADALMDSVLAYANRLIQANSATEVHVILQGLMEQLLEAVEQQRLRDRRQKVRRAIQYIHAHYHRGLSLEDVAGVVGLSYSYFSRLFSRETGMSFQEYLTQIRLENAKQLLLTTNLTVEEITAQVGYEDASHFIRVFKRCSGITPRRFAHTNRLAHPPVPPETGLKVASG